MKFRNGFVSNSSSSSYIIYGIFRDDLPEDILKRINDEGFHDFPWDILFCDDEVIGKSIAYWSDGSEKINPDISKENLDSIKEEVKKTFKASFDYDIPDEIFGLIGSTYYG